MKKIFYLLFLSLYVFTSCNQDEEIIDLTLKKGKPEKVTICHYDPHNDTWKTKKINEKHLAKHLEHGDYLGECDAKTYVPDDAFEYALIYWGYDDVMDDYVLTSNINTIEDLTFDEPCCTLPWSITNQAIPIGAVKDFTGIEDFIALKNLYINSHESPNLDLTQNIALENFNLAHNFIIASLDLSKNIALKSIGIYEDTKMDSYDLSQNIALESVSFDTSILNRLNLKNGNNHILTNFSSSASSNLLCIQVDDAAWSATNWTSVDSWTTFSEDCDAKTYVPDDAFEYALIYWGYDDVMDDYVLTLNINLIEDLTFDDPCCTLPWSITNQGIPVGPVYDFTGIEDFSALKRLYINAHASPSLDLTQNLALESLSLAHNFTIASLDLSKNIALTGMSIWEDNKIENFDLSQNIALESVSFDTSILNRLNLKNGNNHILTNFSSSASSNLLCIQVDDAAWSATNWTSVDSWTTFSEDCDALTYVPDDGFEMLLIISGYDDVMDDYVLTSRINTVLKLDIEDITESQDGSADRTVYNLIGLEDFVALETLSIGNYSQQTFHINDLDLTKNINLKYLLIGPVPLTNLDLSNNIALEHLEFYTNPLSNLDLSNNTALIKVSVDSSPNLINLNLKNGNNSIISNFHSFSNSLLTCIQVDDADAANAGDAPYTNWVKDVTSIYSEDCGY